MREVGDEVKLEGWSQRAYEAGGLKKVCRLFEEEGNQYVSLMANLIITLEESPAVLLLKELLSTDSLEINHHLREKVEQPLPPHPILPEFRGVGPTLHRRVMEGLSARSHEP